ncbi:MAG: hypothetical protein K6L81_02660 [Agarilytica sp.]
MAVFTYTALRGVAPAHTAGLSYSVNVRDKRRQPKNNTDDVSSVSLSGKVQTVVHRRDKFIVFNTVMIDGDTAEFLEVFEFLESVDESEFFTVDIGAGPQLAKLEGNYTAQRNGPVNEWSFSFQVRILP